ncbi:MAG: efflux RND transporter periplasmic adaptor subunit [Candidatus Saccharimonas sp.]|nr:efflux RND transporter periplasmic adaptor subunit [Planctomycetaceae bacterium]
MAVSSAEADPPADALAKLRIQRAEPQRSGSWLKRLLLAAVILLGTVAVGVALAYGNGWISVGQNWLAVPEIMQSRLEVRLASVTVESGRSADATVVATGYLESRRQANIGARAPGRIELIHVEEGSRVETGQVLAVLEHADLDASLSAIEASLARAKATQQEQELTIRQSQREFERTERLWKSKIASETDYEERKFKSESDVARRASLVADVSLAEARVREAEQMKANMFIKAPFNGTVISKDAEVGESILPGGMGEASGRGSAVTVADLEHLEVECDVKEDFISRIVPGQAAEVAVDAVPGFRYQGRVRKIIPMGDRARATIKVKVEIVNVDDRLFPNMSATTYFLPDEKSTAAPTPSRRTFCDSKAIQGGEAERFVWTLDDKDRVSRLDVTTGPERDGRTEISSGLSGGERVIIAPPDTKPGQLVKIAR